jgi:hypothetical protein
MEPAVKGGLALPAVPDVEAADVEAALAAAGLPPQWTIHVVRRDKMKLGGDLDDGLRMSQQWVHAALGEPLHGDAAACVLCVLLAQRVAELAQITAQLSQRAAGMHQSTSDMRYHQAALLELLAGAARAVRQASESLSCAPAR